MLKLIRLEWKKNQIGKYFRNAAILTAVLMSIICLIVGELEADETMSLYGQSMVNASVELLTHMSYIIFTGVMISGFIVNGYEKKTIHLMFSYPIKRQKIVLSQIVAVWTFNFSLLVLSKILIYCTLLLTKPFTHISTESIQLNNLSFWINLIISSAVMISVSFISLLIGLKMNSAKAAIVTSIIVACFTQGNIGIYTLANNIIFYVILLVLSVVSIFFSIVNVEKKDVI